MTISRADVEHVARLARLGLDEAELDHFAEQLNHILQSMEALSRLDTSDIPPTAQVIPLQSVMRDDCPRPCWPVDDVLRNAPRTRDQYFLVSPVLEE